MGRRSGKCCCAAIYTTNCGDYLRSYFGSTNPANWPQTATLNLSASYEVYSKCASPDGTSCAQGIYTRTAVSFSGNFSGNLDQTYPWSGGVAIGDIYRLDGSFTVTVESEMNRCSEQDSVCMNWIWTHGGTMSGAIGCASCPAPTPANPCGSFSVPFYATMGFRLKQPPTPTQFVANSCYCCDPPETELVEWSSEAEAFGTWRAGSVSEGCESCPVPAGCGIPLAGLIGQVLCGPPAFGGGSSSGTGAIFGPSGSCFTESNEYGLLCVGINHSGSAIASFA